MKAQFEQGRFLIQLHLLTDFQIQNYYQNKPKFNGIYSRKKILKAKDVAYVISLNEFKSIGTHWAALYVNGNKATYFESFGVENIPKEIKKFIGSKNILTNIYRIQAYDSIMCK